MSKDSDSGYDGNKCELAVTESSGGGGYNRRGKNDKTHTT